MIELVDTHCHIHEVMKHTTPVHEKWQKAGVTDADVLVHDAYEVGVSRLLCIGTTQADSELAVQFASQHDRVWASIGIHPHEAEDHLESDVQRAFVELVASDKVVAVGECGLDYFYTHSSKQAQEEILRFQIELALKHDLPLSFHVREAFDDFWPIFESYQGIRGVLHSFTDSKEHLERALSHGLYIGVNGIATFTKDQSQLAMYQAIPLNHLLLETDAPFLTPVPYRGTICLPKHVRVTAEFLCKLRGETMSKLASATSSNAVKLFGL